MDGDDRIGDVENLFSQLATTIGTTASPHPPDPMQTSIPIIRTDDRQSKCPQRIFQPPVRSVEHRQLRRHIPPVNRFPRGILILIFTDVTHISAAARKKHRENCERSCCRDSSLHSPSAPRKPLHPKNFKFLPQISGHSRASAFDLCPEKRVTPKRERSRKTGTARDASRCRRNGRDGAATSLP